MVLFTHKLSIFSGYQNVHLRAFGADDLACQWVSTQVDVATVCLVDGDSGHLAQNLDGKEMKSD